MMNGKDFVNKNINSQLLINKIKIIMKVKFTVIAIMIFIVSAKAQDDKFKHFEISANALFWTPTSLHLKSLSSVTQYAYPNGTYISSGSFSGFGTSVAPELQVNYYFQNNLGISLGLNIVHMDNELYVKETDTTYSSYENIAEIENIRLGLSGRWAASNAFKLYYEVGLNLVANYDLEITYSSQDSDPPDLESTGTALGLYCKTGVGIKIYGNFSFNAGLMYSYIPVEMEYTNGEGSEKISEKTNLGGIALQTGLAFNF